MEPISQQRSLVDQTYDILLDAICAGELRPGDRVNQDEVATRLNVSRQPVNSAITMLRAQRFVQDTGRRGVVVAPIDPGLFHEIYQYRTAIEPLAAGLAAGRRTEEALACMASSIERGKRLLEQNKPTEVLEADIAFHHRIYQMSGNTVIQDTMRLNWGHIRRSMVKVLSYPGATELAWREHEVIYQAIAAGDAGLAAAHMRKHMENAINRVAMPGERQAHSQS